MEGFLNVYPTQRLFKHQIQIRLQIQSAQTKLSPRCVMSPAFLFLISHLSLDFQGPNIVQGQAAGVVFTWLPWENLGTAWWPTRRLRQNISIDLGKYEFSSFIQHTYKKTIWSKKLYYQGYRAKQKLLTSRQVLWPGYFPASRLLFLRLTLIPCTWPYP